MHYLCRCLCTVVCGQRGDGKGTCTICASACVLLCPGTVVMGEEHAPTNECCVPAQSESE